MGNKTSFKGKQPQSQTEIKEVQRTESLVSISWQAPDCTLNWNPLYESPYIQSDTESVIGERTYSFSCASGGETLAEASPRSDSDLPQMSENYLSPPLHSMKGDIEGTVHRFSFQLTENPKHIRVRLPTWKQEELERERLQTQQTSNQNPAMLEKILNSPSISSDFSSEVMILWELLDKSFQDANSVNARVQNGSEEVHSRVRMQTIYDRPIIDEPRKYTVDDRPVTPPRRRETVFDSPISPQSEDEWQICDKILPRSYANLEMLLEEPPRSRDTSNATVDFQLFQRMDIDSDGEILISESISPHGSSSDEPESQRPEGRTSATERSFRYVENLIKQSNRRNPEFSKMRTLPSSSEANRRPSTNECGPSLELPRNEKRKTGSLDSVLSQDLYVKGTPEDAISPETFVLEEDGYFYFPRMRDSMIMTDQTQAATEGDRFEGFLE